MVEPSLATNYVQRPCLVNDGSFFEMLRRQKAIKLGPCLDDPAPPLTVTVRNGHL